MKPMSEDYRVPLRVSIREGEDPENALIASGVRFPSGVIIIEWRRTAFVEERRTTRPVRSVYQTEADAEKATGGTLRYLDDPHETTEEKGVVA